MVDKDASYTPVTSNSTCTITGLLQACFGSVFEQHTIGIFAQFHTNLSCVQ